MIIFSDYLVKAEDLERKIEIACSFNNAKCECIRGIIQKYEAQKSKD